MNRILKLITPFALTLALTGALPGILAGGGAYAMGGDSGSADKPADPTYAAAKQLVENGKYSEAIPLLEEVVAKDDKNADAFNYLGYSNRQLGNNDAALAHYQKALALEPRHRGANEYLGELYLILGDLEKAEERLDVLDGACFFGCEEYTELKNAIAEYKAKAGS
ncbi:tetratricopeptide repeat protein [Pelagibius sp. CAU 1746]|uniref:tetratricopeptide repeat protein n=1 Tax=Pelagibius sp. CAU 1746 TaxID=3140370 RepID=UPI00325B9BB9